MNDKVYKTIFVEWRGRHSYTSLTLHNLTKEQAIENAKFFDGKNHVNGNSGKQSFRIL